MEKFRFTTWDKLILSLFCVLFISDSYSQNEIVQQYYQNYTFSEKDSIRGALRPERNCYDVQYYDLQLEIDPKNRSIAGVNHLSFDWLGGADQLQIDLFENMKVDSILLDGVPCEWERLYDALFVELCANVKPSFTHRLSIYYHGVPIAAKTPPWDGGFVWSEDSHKNPWIGVACEGIGASLWWPNKDHLSDEPDSMKISLTVPNELMAVANGNLLEVKEQGDKTCYVWAVTYPINNYNVSVNIGDYVHFNDVYQSKDGKELACDYYVLRENEKVAREHFKQVDGVLEAFEHYFGPYPFWEDGFALVETPYLGMEHQSGIAYGNKYMRGYLGGMIPDDMDWDYIIVHETGHEYWGNSVSVKDHADMWIHESFTTYMEALYVEYHFGRDAVDRYLAGQKYHGNFQPVVGPYDVNFEDWKNSDHYFKGSWILHSLRTVLNNDDLWFDLLRAVYDEFALSTTDTDEIVSFISSYTDKDLGPFFEQYLLHPKVPVFEYFLQQKGNDLHIRYRLEAQAKGLQLPISVGTEYNLTRLPTTDVWRKVTLNDVHEDDFYIDQKSILIKEKELWEKPKMK